MSYKYNTGSVVCSVKGQLLFLPLHCYTKVVHALNCTDNSSVRLLSVHMLAPYACTHLCNLEMRDLFRILDTCVFRLIFTFCLLFFPLQEAVKEKEEVA